MKRLIIKNMVLYNLTTELKRTLHCRLIIKLKDLSKIREMEDPND